MSKTVRPQRGLEAVRPYVPGKPIEEVIREQGVDDVVKLASNENPLGVSPKALSAMREALEHVNLYPDSASHDLRAAIAERFGLSIDRVAVGGGADDLILELAMAYLEDGDEVVISRSSFPVYDIYVAAMRAKLVKTPLASGYRVDLDATADAITDRTKIVVVCNPNNPTGTIVTADELDPFVRCVPEGVLIVVDEAYAEMVDSDAFPDAMAYVRDGRPNVLVLRTFSKVYGLAGIRLGYAFGVPETIAALHRVKNIFNVSVVAQAAGIAALRDEEFVKESVRANAAGRRYLCREFDRLGLEHAESHTNFVLVRIGPDAGRIYERLLERGIIVRPCAQYDLPDFLRISIGTAEQNERLIGALEELVASRHA
jgi:histidinol-phosphate aminotransferase